MAYKVSHKGRWGLVEPATVAKVEAPLNGRVWMSWFRASTSDPKPIPESPVGLIKRQHQPYQGFAKGNDSDLPLYLAR